MAEVARTPFEHLQQRRGVGVVGQKWDDSGTPVDRSTYTYDRNSNRLTKANRLHTAHSESYTYDTLNRLATTNRNGAAHQSWDLDALGNSSSVTTGGVTETRTHNGQNQLTGIDSNALAFDANGNTTTDQNGRSLVYDAWNRLVEAKNGSTSLIRYEYDGLTRRIEEDAATEPAVHQYFSAAWQVLEERNASNQTTASYAWSPVYVDAMIARDRNTDLNDADLEERLYVLQDANFNVTAIADTSGSIVERYLYDPYGQRTILDASYANDADEVSDFAFQHGHQGGKYDSVLSNQILFRNRVYDVETMRWLQNDPLGYPDGLSSYVGLRSSPLVHLDAYGLQVPVPIPTPTPTPLALPTQAQAVGIAAGLALAYATYKDALNAGNWARALSGIHDTKLAMLNAQIPEEVVNSWAYNAAVLVRQAQAAAEALTQSSTPVKCDPVTSDAEPARPVLPGERPTLDYETPPPPSPQPPIDPRLIKWLLIGAGALTVVLLTPSSTGPATPTPAPTPPTPPNPGPTSGPTTPVPTSWSYLNMGGGKIIKRTYYSDGTHRDEPK